MSFLTGACCAYRRAASPMLMARSPTRSRSVLILTRGDDGPQVHGHGLVERQQHKAPAVDLDVQLVERLVAVEDPFDELAVAVHERLDREAHLFLGEAAHFEQPRLELFQLFLKVSSVTLHGLHYPNRPVT